MDTAVIYFTISELRVTTAQHVLAEAGIKSFILNQKDSMHTGIFGGKIKLYVHQEDQTKASEILVLEGILDEGYV